MSYQRISYMPPRPELTIYREGGNKLGNCYYQHIFIVESTRQLSQENLKDLALAGFLGYGQEFIIDSQCDGKEEPSGWDKLQNSDKTIGNRQTNTFNKPWWSYKIIRRVDSSD